jgi:hypothetical protein
MTTKKLLKLEEKYNFKKEKDESWSFKYNTKKAFILNLTDPLNIKIITPFILRRKQLGEVSQKIFQEIHNIEKSDLSTFMAFSIEIIGNMLDKRKMGSVEYFINMIYLDIKSKADKFAIIPILGELVEIIDYSTDYHLSQFPDQKMEAIHAAYFEIVLKGLTDEYLINNDGEVQLLTRIEEDPDPQNEYNLADMTPINLEEI